MSVSPEGGALMTTPVRPLIEVLREVRDGRQAQGKRHPLHAVLALACAAMLSGYRTYSAMAEWGRNYDGELVRALGFTHAPPCAATFFHVFRRLDRADLEARLGAWAEAVLQTTPAAAPPALEAVAIDGKTLRGSRKQGAPGAHLLSAVSHRLGLTLGQRPVDDKRNEITAAPTILAGLVLEGRVVTMDALLTQRSLAQQIVAAGGDYVMLMKKNHPGVQADIALAFSSPPPAPTHRGRRPAPRSGGTGGAKPAG